MIRTRRHLLVKCAEPDEDRPMRTILIASSKGGCGKTLVATNLAAFYALADKRTVLVDTDPQESSLHWCGRRSGLAKGAVLGLSASLGAKTLAKIPKDAERIVIDAPAGTSAAEVAAIAPSLDAVLVPVVPSVIDLDATERFLDGLKASHEFRRSKVPVAIVANRLKPWTNLSRSNLERMQSLGPPVIAELRDSGGYALMAGLGRSIFDYHSEQVLGHQEDWTPLLKWIKKLDR
jgi:chromosome partitioning protein